MYYDYHVHTRFSGDSDTPVTDQIKQAVSLGMKELCFTDHHDYDVDSGDINFELDFPNYFASLRSQKEQYKDQIKLRIGLELGLQPHLVSYHQELLKQHSFDFIIGSTHFIHGKDPYYPAYFLNRDEKDVFREFFVETLNNIQLFSDFDVVGHLDYIVRYAPSKDKNYQCRDYQDLITEILALIIEKGVGLECNTSGLRSGTSQPNPHIDILKLYRHMGGEIITVGSDSHTADTLGFQFETAKELLQTSGFRYYTTFEDRKPIFHPL